MLFAEPLNPVRKLRTFVTLVRELCDRESRRLKTWLSDVLDVVSRSGLGISAPDKSRFQ